MVALKHAGPSITITSFTNVLAFYFGSTASIIALSSFCIFAAVSVCMLYCTVLTLFLCALVWDTQRVGNKKTECCRLFCCKEDSIIFCKGKFLSKTQRDFSGIGDKEEISEKQVFEQAADAENIVV